MPVFHFWRFIHQCQDLFTDSGIKMNVQLINVMCFWNSIESFLLSRMWASSCLPLYLRPGWWNIHGPCGKNRASHTFAHFFFFFFYDTSQVIPQRAQWLLFPTWLWISLLHTSQPLKSLEVAPKTASIVFLVTLFAQNATEIHPADGISNFGPLCLWINGVSEGKVTNYRSGSHGQDISKGCSEWWVKETADEWRD